MGDVLHTEFPPMISALFESMKFLVVNIHGVVALECAGLKSFHSTWIFEILIVPGILCIIVGLYWLYRNRTQGREQANAKAMDEGFFVLFLCYPFVTNKLFSVLNCRILSRDVEVLVADYSVDCSTSQHATYGKRTPSILDCASNDSDSSCFRRNGFILHDLDVLDGCADHADCCAASQCKVDARPV